MSFLNLIEEFEDFDFEGHLNTVTDRDVQRALSKERLNHKDFLALLSDRAEPYLETMASKARKITLQHFGRTIGLYAPIYISDYCSNHCIYCGFNSTNSFRRRKLTIDEVETEARLLAETGIRHVILLTGEAPAKTPLPYLEESVRVMRKYFSSLSLEIFPMDEADYTVLNRAGADSLTVYQETYDREVYESVHLAGKKRDYGWRLLAPERGARAGFRSVNIGALFGLGKIHKEAFFSGLHARFLEHRYPDVEVGISIPRMRKAEGAIDPRNILDDLRFVQFMAAYRLFLPKVGISISTREAPEFRDRLVHLGITRLSAGCKTDVGGYANSTETDTAQFQISDERSVDQVVAMIRNNGYQPVFKDWDRI
ncbi:MAG: 2-iminoacetate synthase ThiH [Desulfobacteraceae bacterium]|nr:2-iminoacetate synthase ThiH [Desulfobacteraceae bacterium]